MKQAKLREKEFLKSDDGLLKAELICTIIGISGPIGNIGWGS